MTINNKVLYCHGDQTTFQKGFQSRIEFNNGKKKEKEKEKRHEILRKSI